METDAMKKKSMEDDCAKGAMSSDAMSGDAMKAAFAKVFYRFVVLIPGDPWVRSEYMKERFSDSWAYASQAQPR